MSNGNADKNVVEMEMEMQMQVKAVDFDFYNGKPFLVSLTLPHPQTSKMTSTMMISIDTPVMESA